MPEDPKPPEVGVEQVTRETTVSSVGPAVPTLGGKMVEQFMALVILAATFLSALCTMAAVWLFPTNDKIFALLAGLTGAFSGSFLTLLQQSKRQ